MQEFVNNIITNLQEVSQSLPLIYSILFSFFIIVMESILPMLPLGVFIALNMVLLGNVFGFFVSWIATSTGCLLSFILVRKLFYDKFSKRMEEKEKSRKLVKGINKLSFSSFVVITALPFTPAFVINIVCGLSKMSIKKFISGILIAKIFITYFWGFIGTTFLQSVTDMKVLIELLVMLIAAYLLSKLAMKKYNID